MLKAIFLAPGRFLSKVMADYRAEMAQRRARKAAGHCMYCGSPEAEQGLCYDCWYVRR